MPWIDGHYETRLQQRGADDDRRCPPGHRLLVQVLDYDTEAEARAWLVRTFGAAKGNAAVLVKGTRQPLGGTACLGETPWEWFDVGFRAYLPIGFRSLA